MTTEEVNKLKANDIIYYHGAGDFENFKQIITKMIGNKIHTNSGKVFHRRDIEEDFSLNEKEARIIFIKSYRTQYEANITFHGDYLKKAQNDLDVLLETHKDFIEENSEMFI